VAAAQTARCVIAITSIADARVLLLAVRNEGVTNSRIYDGLWDLSLIDERNERPLHVAFVAVIGIWATALLFALV
jgi:hypothetical protein